MRDGRGETTGAESHAQAVGLARGRGRAHALELVLDEVGEQAVRTSWAALAAGGVPSLMRHTGATHRPHVTVLSGPPPPEKALRLAAEAIGGLLPVDLRVSGLGLLGRPGWSTLVELVTPPIALLGVRARLVELWPGADPRPWLPHLTLAQRLSPEAVATALSLLAQASAGERSAERATSSPAGEGIRRVVGLRWWNPEQDRVLMLAGG
ncbi:2'-5' RNA ligase family protein [Ornithinimicrobium sufpigmenti]|uniref:2'-5' RNA ligase family protein n=1 Tax=Ornithinimicrobium sufpigmenti TaxID=2508882 RepID=UPI00103634F8|nr:MULTISPECIES: 2'-5' RNA ligase family protein [unclassified Ornithinimicrobium]